MILHDPVLNTTLHISKKNRKLGKTMNVSLPPGITCLPDAPCRLKCYALKFYKMRSRVKKAWDDNLAFYNLNSRAYFADIQAVIQNRKPAYFRWHVSGDVPDILYAENVAAIAEAFPETQFLIYTRVPDYFFYMRSEMPPNLSILESQWLGYDHTPSIFSLPTFMVVKPGLVIPMNDPKINHFHCPGYCPDCRVCWRAKSLNISLIVHNLH